MNSITITVEEIRDIEDLDGLHNPLPLDMIYIRLEDALDCNGTVCGERYRDGEEREPGPHKHLIVSGDKSKTSVELCTYVKNVEFVDVCR